MDNRKQNHDANKQPDFIEGWNGSLPTKQFPSNANFKLSEDKPNVEYHDHGPRDKCGLSCRFFKNKTIAQQSSHLTTKIQNKNKLNST